MIVPSIAFADVIIHLNIRVQMCGGVTKAAIALWCLIAAYPRRFVCQ